MFPFWIDFEITALLQSTAAITVTITWLLSRVAGPARP